MALSSLFSTCKALFMRSFRRREQQSEPGTTNLHPYLQESVITDDNWETESWLGYNFPRRIHSVPSSLTNSWVNLDFNCQSDDGPEEGSVDRTRSVGSISGEEECTISTGEPMTSTPNLATKTIPEQPILDIADLDLGALEEMCSSLERSVVHKSIMESPAHVSVHAGSTRSRRQRSSTFSGAGSKKHPSPSEYCNQSTGGSPVPAVYTSLTLGASLTTKSTASDVNTEKGDFIHDLFKKNIVTLVEHINPPDVARHLFNLSIISKTELRRAGNGCIDESERAQAIVLSLMKKLKRKPSLFSDVFAALKKSGVEVIQDIKVAIQQEYPHDNVVTGSVSVLSIIESCALDSLSRTIYKPHSVSVGSEASSSSGTREDLPDLTVARDLDAMLVELDQAIQEDNLPLAQELVAREATQQDEPSLVYLVCKLRVVNIRVFKFVLSTLTPDVNAKNKSGRTLLHVACASFKVEANSQQNIAESNIMFQQQRAKVMILLEHGARNTEQDVDGNSPLHLATLARDRDTIELLLKHNVQCINMTNNLGNTALHIACRDGYPEIVTLLCEYKADATIRNSTKKQRTPLLEACSHEHVGVARAIVNYDTSSLEDSDSKKRSPMHMATQRQNSSLAENLLKYPKCQPYTLDQENKTPLHYACYGGTLDMVNPLLKRNKSKAFINAQDRNGDTALHIASRRGRIEIIKRLIKKKASKSIKNQNGKTPEDEARQWEHETPAKILSKKGPWHSERRKRSRTISTKQPGAECVVEPQWDLPLVSSPESGVDDNVCDY